MVVLTKLTVLNDKILPSKKIIIKVTHTSGMPPVLTRSVTPGKLDVGR